MIDSTTHTSYKNINLSSISRESVAVLGFVAGRFRNRKVTWWCQVKKGKSFPQLSINGGMDGIFVQCWYHSINNDLNNNKQQNNQLHGKIFTKMKAFE